MEELTSSLGIKKKKKTQLSANKSGQQDTRLIY